MMFNSVNNDLILLFRFMRIWCMCANTPVKYVLWFVFIKAVLLTKHDLRSATDNTNIFTLAFSKLLLNIYVNGCFKSRAVSVLKSPVSSLANNTKENMLKTWIIELFNCLSKLRGVFWSKDYKHSMKIDNIDLWLKLPHLFSITPPLSLGQTLQLLLFPSELLPSLSLS